MKVGYFFRLEFCLLTVAQSLVNPSEFEMGRSKNKRGPAENRDLASDAAEKTDDSRGDTAKDVLQRFETHFETTLSQRILG